MKPIANLAGPLVRRLGVVPMHAAIVDVEHFVDAPVAVVIHCGIHARVLRAARHVERLHSVLGRLLGWRWRG